MSQPQEDERYGLKAFVDGVFDAAASDPLTGEGLQIDILSAADTGPGIGPRIFMARWKRRGRCRSIVLSRR